MEVVWDALPTTLSKLVVDVGQAVRLEPLDSMHALYLPLESMKPLVNFKKLEELRIFNMRDSLQPIIWETVFQNEAGNQGMRILELQMAAAPLVRKDHWIQGKAVEGLFVSNDDPQEYK